METNMHFRCALGKRLSLLRELAVTLAEAQTAVLRSDLGEIKRCTQEQQHICAALRQIENRSALSDDGQRAESELSGEELIAQVQQAAARARHLNRIYLALLRRARRTVDVFCHVLAASAITYAPPRPTQTVCGATHV